MLKSIVAFTTCILFATSCGEYHSSTGEDYGDIIQGPSTTILTQSEHSTGWGKSNCFLCHSEENIHRVNRTSLGFDMEGIRNIVEREGLSSCQSCHGNNGVE